MKIGYREVCLEHDTGTRHPETADRLRAIRRGLAKKHGVEYHGGRDVTRAELEAVHDPDYLASIRSFCESGGGTWDADTIAVEATWPAAVASAGLACWAAEAALVAGGRRELPFSIGRPPGHHAERDDAMGFCFFNNAAIAAASVLDREDVDRVAIFDWDVHHGNGTQDIVADRGDVYYASVHERGLYPGTGHVEEIGRGDGAGTVMNVPLTGGSGDAEYLAVIDELLAPALASFDPDLLLVSAGFDAHRHDPISRMRVTTDGYAAMAERVLDTADDVDAATAFVLEGGYSLQALSESVAAVHEVVHGLEPVGPDEPASDACTRVIEAVRDAHDL